MFLAKSCLPKVVETNLPVVDEIYLYGLGIKSIKIAVNATAAFALSPDARYNPVAAMSQVADTTSNPQEI